MLLKTKQSAVGGQQAAVGRQRSAIPVCAGTNQQSAFGNRQSSTPARRAAKVDPMEALRYGYEARRIG